MAYDPSVASPEEITRHHDFDPTDDEVWIDPDHRGAPLELVPYDPSWPQAFETVAARIRAALGERVVALDHVGSTAVPGLPAKPVIDVDLTVADSGDEPSYVPPLEAAGFRLVVREPNWHRHRMLTGDDPRTNLHVFSPDCPEVIRCRLFRDWLRDHPDDLARYRDAKLAAVAETTTAGEHVADYNQRKQPVIRDIYNRLFRAHGLL